VRLPQPGSGERAEVACDHASIAQRCFDRFIQAASRGRQVLPYARASMGLLMSEERHARSRKAISKVQRQ
jgi:hypothetical protein